MVWIRVVEPEEAEGELLRVYREIAEKRGKVANVHKGSPLYMFLYECV